MSEAWIGLAGAIIAALISVLVAIRQMRANERLEHVKRELDTRLEHVKSELAADLAKVQSDLDTERHRREAEIDRGFNAEDVLERYREPLAVAAFDLQSRLYNILQLEFFQKFGEPHARGKIAVKTTLFRLAQYFGWTEIMRRDIQFLSFPQAEHTRHVVKLQSDIARTFLTDEHGEAMMIWGDEQRALGELMIVEEHGKILSMGFAKFSELCDTDFAPWIERLQSELFTDEARERLRRAQNLLCDFVVTLDVNRVRYDEQLKRA